jgi:plastocyanin
MAKVKKTLIFGAIVILLAIGIGLYFFMPKSPVPNNLENNSLASNFQSPNTPLKYEVTISEYKFSPLVTVVQKGSTVIWTNNDPVPHTVTSDSGTELSSPLIGAGNSYSHIFNVSGTFDYHCSIHTMMKGEVIVQ